VPELPIKSAENTTSVAIPLLLSCTPVSFAPVKSSAIIKYLLILKPPYIT